MPSLKEQLLPTISQPIQQLVDAAGINVRSWAIGKDGQDIAENQNVYKNFLWAFGGSTPSEPIALCIWHREVDWDQDPPVRQGNNKNTQDDLNALASRYLDPSVRRRISQKVLRLKIFGNLIREAFLRTRPVRVILLEGTRAFGEDAAHASSKVSARLLDAEPWYVHQADPHSGDFKIIRGVRPQAPPIPDPDDGLEDPALDARFQTFIDFLKDTEREALIKARVNQGVFRQRLLERWGKRCSITDCAIPATLIASHIKPWSLCTLVSERLGASNGLLLTPNIDKAFDRGFISFDERFAMVFSPALKGRLGTDFNLHPNMKIRAVGDRSDLAPFLRWHREHIFKSQA